MIIGFVTPPFGTNLFAACATTEEDFASVTKGALPLIIVEMVIVIILIFCDGITLLLPGLLCGYGA